MTWREELQRQHELRAAEHLWRKRLVRASAQGPRVKIGSQDLWNFSSNDYLGLAQHQALAEVASVAAQRWGTGSGASHLVCGHDETHQQLESELADMLGAERALLFSTGYMANLAIPQALLQAGDLVLEDRLNHASLIDGGQSSPATFRRFAHASPTAMRERWLRHQGRHAEARLMVMTDSVFSMDGDLAPLSELHAEVPEDNGLLVIDEAHGWGVLGSQGGGLWQQLGHRPSGRVLVVGTLGKAAGSFGAFVAGDAIWIEQLIQFARPYIYTTALPPTVVAASAAAVRLIVDGQLRQTLQQRLRQFYDGLAQSTQQRFQVVASRVDPAGPLSAIVALVVGESEAAMAISGRLAELGFWVPAIRPPTVPAGTARLRLTFSAAHPPESIDKLLQALHDSQLLSRWPESASSTTEGSPA